MVVVAVDSPGATAACPTMTNTNTNTNTNDTCVRQSGDDAPPLGFDYVTIENENAPDECAIFPRSATEEELMTNWIAADEDSVVDLESMR